MPMFVHLTPESCAKSIRRNGISRLRKSPSGERGLFAMPVTRNFYVSHQWLRELRRNHRGGPIVGVYFRIDDDETVSVGHYRQAHREMTAAEAASEIMSSESREGFEVIIHRKVAAAEIHRIRKLPQVLGWRYYPQSHGREPCDCRFCQRGEYGGKKIQRRYSIS